MRNPTAYPVAALDAELDGDAVAPGDAAWDDARRAWNLAFDQQPVAVARVAGTQDVQRTVRFAAAHGLRVVPQGTGHGAGSAGALDDAILLRTQGLGGVDVDPATRIARVGAGVQWRDVVAVASPLGLAGLAGTSGTVGVAGYTLGGGAGWLVRRHGVSAWSLRAAELVTAAGELVRATDDEHADLLWALRGSGRSPGVVTALELELVELREVVGGGLWWPIDAAHDVFRTWAQLVGDLSDDVTSIARLLRFPPLPELPEHLRGKSFATVEAVSVGGAAPLQGLLDALRGLGPVTDTVQPMPAAELAAVHGDPVDPVAGVGAGHLLTDLPQAALDALLEVGGPGASPSLIGIEVRHLDGAAARNAPVPSSLHVLHEPFAAFAVGPAMTEGMRAATEASLTEVAGAVAPWTSERTVPTLADRPIDPETALGADVARRLGKVEAAYDPDGRFTRA
jgi:hypothetical protein